MLEELSVSCNICGGKWSDSILGRDLSDGKGGESRKREEDVGQSLASDRWVQMSGDAVI